jgi:phage-related protein
LVAPAEFAAPAPFIISKMRLRLTGRDGIARALYVTAMGRRVIVVRAFVKKKQKTPRAEIELALHRAKEIT